MHIFTKARHALARFAILPAIGLALSACGGSGSTPPPQSEVLSGKTAFVSADAGSIARTVDVIATAADVSSPTGDKAARTVAEGDIYRVLEAGKTILNLNQFRGLQVIDISDPARPGIVGRAAFAGAPVEMYRVGQRVYVLLNGWSDYRRVLKDGKELLDQFSGAGVLTIDISNPAAPRIADATRLGGYIVSSRLTSGGGKSALYVTTNDFGALQGGIVAPQGQTQVYSYGVGPQGELQARSTLALGGYVQAIQAAGDRLMVARGEAWSPTPSTRIGVIDIASADGVMLQGADVKVSGVVLQKNNMHVQGNVMRVVSAATWGTASTANHLETFDIADIARPRAIDHATFGAGQQLFGTTFLPDRAFFVTYLRQDPFHAFSITADGHVKEESEFIVSGWNDFFAPVLSATRLIGIGQNDENNRRVLAVSLYDVSNLKDPTPLRARADLDLANGWSEANWDDRAFTVLDNGANAMAADGNTHEAGLVLLPFTGWNEKEQRYESGVQIFTFPANTLTRRGLMSQPTHVRRSFMSDAVTGLAANLSDTELSLFNISNADQPAARGTLDLAPSFGQYLVFANVGVRYRENAQPYWGGMSKSQTTDAVEIVAPGNAEASSVLASIGVAASSQLYNVGGKLVVVSPLHSATGASTTISTYDLSNPAKPVLEGQLTTDQLQNTNNYTYLTDVIICPMNLRCGPMLAPQARVVGSSLVFVSQAAQSVMPATSTGFARYWASYIFQVVDLSNAAKPLLQPKISMPVDEEMVSVVQNGSTLWVNYKKPTAGASTDQPEAKFFVKTLDLSQPAAPKLGNAVNVPGQLMAVSGDSIYTFDTSWNAKQLEHSVNILVVRNDLAYLQASLKSAGKPPTGLLLDGASIVVSTTDAMSSTTSVSVYTIVDKQFAEQATIGLGGYATLEAVKSGKLLVRVSNGFLLYDLSQPKSSVVQAWFPATGAGALLVQGNDIYLAAHNFGIYQFNFNTVNLAAP